MMQNELEEIKIQNLGVNYHMADQEDFIALADINLSIRKGEFIVVVGPSGCGKTTLLNVLAGFQKPSNGKVTMGGKEISNPGPDKAVVFQDYALLPWRTVSENLNFVYELNPSLCPDKKERQEKIQEFLELVGLKGFANYYPNRLSGGMRQRVGIARALAVKPRLLLMDEPFAAVDVMTRGYMQGEIERILENENLTILFVTHSVEEAVILADRILVMTAAPGRIKAEIKVNLPRPRRSLDFKLNPDFQTLCSEISGLLTGEIKKTINLI